MTELVVTTPEALYELTIRALRDFDAQREVTPRSDWLTLKSACEYLGVTEQTIRNWVAQRTIPYRKAGGKLMFSRKAVDAWINDG